MTEPIRVLIADDHPLFRDGLTALLTDGPDTELTGAATSGTEAVELARETQPDVVIMDLHMPGLNGIEATRRIVADSPHIKVLVLTMFDDDDSIFSALRAGARGYLLKGADQEHPAAGVPAADRPGARGARPGRPGPGQPGHRDQAGAEPEDGTQSRLQHLDQAAGRRPRPGHRPGQGRGLGTSVPGLRDIRPISS